MNVNVEKISDGIYQSTEEIVRFSHEHVEFVKEQARKNHRKRARICAHSSNKDALHEMIIGICADSYIHPHRHHGKSESFHIVDGEVDVVIFNEDGDIKELVKLGCPDSGKDFFYRLSNADYHTLLIHNEMLVVHEVTNGPFIPEETELAPFAPKESDVEQVEEFISSLRQRVYGS